MQSSALNLHAKPLALFESAEVQDLESDPRRIELAEARDHVGGAATRSAECDAGNARELLLAQPVKFRGQLRSSSGQSAQRIERYGHVAVVANCVYKLTRRGDIAKKSGIELSR